VLRAQLYTYDTPLFHAIHSVVVFTTSCLPGLGNINLNDNVWRSEGAEDLLCGRLIDSGVVGLNVSTLDFAILNHQCVALATVLAKDSGTLEREVKVLGELTGRIAEKADTSLGGWVKGSTPGFHDEWVIDRHNENFAGFLKLVALDIARDVSGRARRAEGRRHAYDKTFAGGELLGQVDLVTGGTFDEVNVRDGSTDFNHVGECWMEGSNGFVCCLMN